MVTVYIGLGSNIGQREHHVWNAVDHMAANSHIEVIGVSTLLQTKALGPIDQPDYLNAVAHIETDLKPLELLEALLEIERRMGRVRREKWGPRVIDLDILYYGQETIQEPQLTVPHPEIQNRDFVIQGLRELKHPAFREE